MLRRIWSDPTRRRRVCRRALRVCLSVWVCLYVRAVPGASRLYPRAAVCRSPLSWPPFVPAVLPAARSHAQEAGPGSPESASGVSCPHVRGAPSSTAPWGARWLPFLGDEVTGEAAASKQIAGERAGLAAAVSVPASLAVAPEPTPPSARACARWELEASGLFPRRSLVRVVSQAVVMLPGRCAVVSGSILPGASSVHKLMLFKVCCILRKDFNRLVAQELPTIAGCWSSSWALARKLFCTIPWVAGQATLGSWLILGCLAFSPFYFNGVVQCSQIPSFSLRPRPLMQFRCNAVFKIAACILPSVIPSS